MNREKDGKIDGRVGERGRERAMFVKVLAFEQLSRIQMREGKEKNLKII